MLLTDINIDDLNRLKQFRIERFLHFFTSSLPHCLIQIDGGDTLAVYCPHPWIVDELIDDLENLCNHAWLILGVRAITQWRGYAIALYFCQEEILRTDTYLR